VDQKEFGFTRVNRREVKADFNGGDVSSDAGLLLLREVDRRLGLTQSAAKVLADPRQKGKIRHEAETMVRQRVFGLCAGYEDLNDFDTLRDDGLFQMVSESDKQLAGKCTLCRMENQQGREVAVAMNTLLVDQFIASKKHAPKEIILDFDATDDPIHGNQEGGFFHGYYDHHCFLPLFVFCEGQLLVAYLRRSNQDAATHAGAILKLLVKRIRQQWPRTRIIFRADSGFCRDRTLSWCDRNDVWYVVGIAKNEHLKDLGAQLQQEAKERFDQTGTKQRLFQGFAYKAKSWKWMRWAVHKAEHGPKGDNPRFVITNIDADPREIYDGIYCPRGEMENRIKEQLQLFHDRTSAHGWWANQWRLLLSALAYTLMEALRRLGLKGTELAKAQCANIRLKLVKIGAIIIRKARVIRVHFSQAYPYQDIFAVAHRRFAPG
jgi:hypothetical protein